MKTEARFNKESHDRVQVGRARSYIREHMGDEISLAAIAAVADVSPFHFSRLFTAVTGETVFGYVSRVRIRTAADLLVGNPRQAVTDVALTVGYQTPSAFNRVFRATLGVSPTRFRTASPAQRHTWLKRLGDPRRRRIMKLDLATTPVFQERVERPYLHVTRYGVCQEEAPLAWMEMNPIAAASGAPDPESEFIGSSFDDPKRKPDAGMRYDAGFTVKPGVRPPAGLTLGKVAGGRYAVFRYRGSYRYIWHAVDQIFQGWGAEHSDTLRAAPLLEVYLNDPRETPEADLLTDLCIPVQ
ncbi:MAG TPA: AraC family transcriptional regulator [bacterium]